MAIQRSNSARNNAAVDTLRKQIESLRVSIGKDSDFIRTAVGKVIERLEKSEGKAQEIERRIDAIEDVVFEETELRPGDVLPDPATIAPCVGCKQTYDNCKDLASGCCSQCTHSVLRTTTSDISAGAVDKKP